MARPGGSSSRENDVIFFYGANADYGGGAAEFRDIPTDGRQRNPRTASQAYYYGNSIGRWEGDTLVIDSINFVDTTWLGRGGLFHSGSMHIIERLTRVGNEIRYDMTIEDPEVFVEPFVMPTRILRQGGARLAAATESRQSARIARCTKRAASRISFDTEN